MIRLEQNYRSTGTILDAANASSITTRADSAEAVDRRRRGRKIKLYAAFNDLEEARFIVERIRRWVDEGKRRADAAILYRSNAQSRVIEEALIGAAIPYRIYGGFRFFERAEIKDALAYLRLIANRNDDPSFERVVNTPTRGIGERTIDQLRQRARETGMSMWQAAREICASDELAARSSNALRSFLELIERMDTDTTDLPLYEQVDHLTSAADSSLITRRKKANADRPASRTWRNWSARRAGSVFARGNRHGAAAGLSFPRRTRSGRRPGRPTQRLRAADDAAFGEGTEFPLVFLAGVEEGMFPHNRSVEEPGRLEEERRLCYVGITAPSASSTSPTPRCGACTARRCSSRHRVSSPRFPPN